jgi:hypothetical protein
MLMLGITVSLPYGHEIHRSAVQAAGVLTVDIHTVALADLLADGSHMRLLPGRLRHG